VACPLLRLLLVHSRPWGALARLVFCGAGLLAMRLFCRHSRRGRKECRVLRPVSGSDGTGSEVALTGTFLLIFFFWARAGEVGVGCWVYEGRSEGTSHAEMAGDSRYSTIKRDGGADKQQTDGLFSFFLSGLRPQPG
jgi:hypothetical protein